MRRRMLDLVGVTLLAGSLLWLLLLLHASPTDAGLTVRSWLPSQTTPASR